MSEAGVPGVEGVQSGASDGASRSPVRYYLRPVELLFFALILLVDLYTKHLATTHLEYGEPYVVIPKVFNLTLVHNPGAAFSMFSTLPDTARRIALATVSVFALIVLFWFMFREAAHDRIARVALAGILGGAVGNIVDRLRFDAVVDFIEVYIGSYHWPNFNVADSAISVGVAVVMLRMVFGRKASGDVPKDTGAGPS